MSWKFNSLHFALICKGAKAVMRIAREILFSMLIFIVLCLVFWFLVYGHCGAGPLI